jgi:glycerophosphoryl diester phosphodiesterase
VARRVFPQDRSVWVPTGGLARTLLAPVPVLVYEDPDPDSEPPELGPAADIRQIDGTAPTVASTLTTEADSETPLWLGTDDGSDTLIVRINGGPPTRVYARVDDRLDTVDAALAALDTRLDAVEPGGAGPIADHATQHGTGGDDPITPAAIGAAPVGHTHTGTYQPLDADLTAIAELTPTGGVVVQESGGTWAARTPTQLAATLPADQAAGTASLRTLGTGAAQAAAGTDARFTTGSAYARITAAEFLATATPRLCAHRGAGDLAPENSLPAFELAVSAGARCMEVSVGRTSDGVLVVNHDLTWDRTLTLAGTSTQFAGTIAATPSTALRGLSIGGMTQVGAAYLGTSAPPVVLFEEILRRYGGRVVLCVEAKLDAAYPAMMAMVEAYGLQPSTIVKAHYTSARLAEAKAAGYATFGYLGSTTEFTSVNIAALVAADVDIIVFPGYDDQASIPAATYSSSERVAEAVATGRHCWPYPLHRRADLTHYVAAGCTGAVVASYPYLATSAALTTRDLWVAGCPMPGEMVLEPFNAAWAATWSGGEIRLARAGQQHFLTLGQLGPLANAAGTYTIDLDVKWPTLPADLTTNFSLVFGRADDSYYQHQGARGSGYHAILRPNGQLQLFRHTDGSGTGTQIGSTVSTTAMVADTWTHLTLAVTPTTITWTRTGFTATSGTDSTHRGGYVQIGRSSTDASIAARSLAVT